ncbi:Follistatin-related protein 4, partial [Varanus komodoensis]
MKPRSFWSFLILLEVFLSIAWGWMESNRSQQFYSAVGRLRQEKSKGGPELVSLGKGFQGLGIASKKVPSYTPTKDYEYGSLHMHGQPFLFYNKHVRWDRPGVSNSRPTGHLPGRVGQRGGALRSSKRRRCLGRPRDEQPTPTAVVEYLRRPSLTQTAPRDKVCSLGVLLDPELPLEAQVTVVARSAFLQLWLIHQLCPYLENNCVATVTHILVTSRLDFCNVLYVGLPLKMVRILQLVQNRAARLLTGTGRCSHITPVLRQLHWLPIEVRAQFKVLVITYKALNGLGPGYLKERLSPYLPSRPLRSAAEALLWEPSVKDIRNPEALKSQEE